MTVFSINLSPLRHFNMNIFASRNKGRTSVNEIESFIIELLGMEMTT